MSQPRLRVGLAGHRNLPKPDLIAGAIRAALTRIEERVPGAALAGISSAAIGADVVFAEILLAQNLSWTLLLPFSKKKFFNPRDFPGDNLRHARSLARKAENTIQVTSDSSPAEKRRESFLECTLCTVDECDVLLAVWDGQPGKEGGTESAVEHARRLGRPLILINSATGGLTEERLDSLSLASLEAPKPEIPSIVNSQFEEHTREAKQHRPWAINLNILLVGLHQLATFVAITALIWKEHSSSEPFDSAALAKVLFLILALFLPVWLKKNSHKWTDHRMQAEILRSVIHLWHLPNPKRVFSSIRPPVFEAMQLELLDQRLRDQPEPLLSVAEYKRDYLRNRVMNQLNYYRDHVQRARAQHAWLHRTANACTWLAIILGVLVSLHWVNEVNPAYHVVKLLSITLPLATATVLAAISARDLKRRMVRYADMAFFLQSARRRIEESFTWEALTEAVIDVEKRLLFEIWEWYSVARYSASH